MDKERLGFQGRAVSDVLQIDELRLWSNMTGVQIDFLARGDNLKLVQQQANKITLTQQQSRERMENMTEGIGENLPPPSSVLAGNIEQMWNHDSLTQLDNEIQDNAFTPFGNEQREALETLNSQGNPLSNMVAGPWSAPTIDDDAIQEEKAKRCANDYGASMKGRAPVSEEATIEWIRKAYNNAEVKRDWKSASDYIEARRVRGHTDSSSELLKDDNLAAAERFLMAYTGFWDDYPVLSAEDFILGQAGLKAFRKYLNCNRGNGSADISHVTKWGLKGKLMQRKGQNPKIFYIKD